MTIAMIEGLHLTATNKRHIAEMIARGMDDAGSKRIAYKITGREGDVVSLTIASKDADDWGRPVWRKGRYVVKVSA
jgi:hypothetical protein